MITHTVGESRIETWNYTPPKGDRIMIIIGTDAVAEMVPLYRPNISQEDYGKEELATAKLFAASTDMYDALQKIDSNAAESVEWIRRVAREALAKAVAGF